MYWPRNKEFTEHILFYLLDNTAKKNLDNTFDVSLKVQLSLVDGLESQMFFLRYYEKALWRPGIPFSFATISRFRVFKSIKYF